jgi:hypothetical protein
MAEQEELKLIVSLTDNASSGIARLRGEVEKLGGGQGKEREFGKHLEELGGGKTQLSLLRLQRGLEGLTRGGFKPVIESAANMGGTLGTLGRMAGVAGAGITLVATAAFAAHKSISALSEEMTRWNQLSRQTGIAIGPLRQMADQMKSQGMDGAAIERTLSSVGASMARFGRDNQRMRAEILRGTNPAGQEAMRQQLDELLPFARAGDAEGYANKVREIAANVRKEVLRSGRGEQRAAAAERETFDLFGVSPDMQVFDGTFKKVSAETSAYQERLNALSKEYQTITSETASAWSRVSDAVGAISFSLFKDFFEDMRSFANWAAGWAEYFAGKKEEPVEPPKTSVPTVPLPRPRPTPGSKFDEQMGGGDNGMGTGARSSVDELKSNIEEEAEQSKKVAEEMGRLTGHLVAEAAKRDAEGGDHGFEISASRRSGGGRGGGGADYGGGVDTSEGTRVTGRGSGNLGKGSWWTPERQQEAVDHLVKNAGLTEIGAQGLVARWAGVESTQGGPHAVNPRGGAAGIAQWLGSRKRGFKMGDFKSQLDKAAHELNTTEKRAGDILRKAQTPAQAAIGATVFERAEGYNARTGTDYFTGKSMRTHEKMIPALRERKAKADAERKTMDGGGTTDSGKVEVDTSGSRIKVDVNAPTGTTVTADFKGSVYNSVETNRSMTDTFVGAS